MEATKAIFLEGESLTLTVSSFIFVNFFFLSNSFFFFTSLCLDMFFEGE